VQRQELFRLYLFYNLANQVWRKTNKKQKKNKQNNEDKKKKQTNKKRIQNINKLVGSLMYTFSTENGGQQGQFKGGTQQIAEKICENIKQMEKCSIVRKK